MIDIDLTGCSVEIRVSVTVSVPIGDDLDEAVAAALEIADSLDAYPLESKHLQVGAKLSAPTGMDPVIVDAGGGLLLEM